MRFLLLSIAALLSLPAHALEVFATVPEWAALAKEIGGGRVNAFAATHALQDPHHIEARPSLIARARRAELVVATGADLEVGWLPVVLRESANPRIQPGRPGHFEAFRFVAMLEVPKVSERLDRAEGDIHAAGNPHIQTDPRNILRVAEALARRMGEVDPGGAEAYRAGFKAFEGRWREALARWERSAAPLRGQPVVVQHRAFPYLIDWLGLRELATLEPKPGVEPSAGHLSRIVAQTAKQKPRLVLRAAYDNSRPAEWFGKQAGVPVAVLPFTVGGSERAGDLFSLFDDTIERLLKAAP